MSVCIILCCLFRCALTGKQNKTLAEEAVMLRQELIHAKAELELKSDMKAAEDKVSLERLVELEATKAAQEKEVQPRMQSIELFSFVASNRWRLRSDTWSKS